MLFSLWSRQTAALTACLLAGCYQALAVTPPPDGGYPNGNTAEGEDALFTLTTGINNTAIGHNALYSISTAGLNTALGYNSLFSDTTGIANTAAGYLALTSNTTGSFNTAFGTNALQNNSTGVDNTAVGNGCMTFNLTGNFNTAVGVGALISGTTGSTNTAVGLNALESNTVGGSNTATGAYALFANTTGQTNTAFGYLALRQNQTGSFNTAIGDAALRHDLGSRNIGLGQSAGFNLTTGSDNIDVGNQGVAGESQTIRVGAVGTQTNAYLAGINGVTVADGIPVVVGADGHLGTVTSSARYKEAVQPMADSSQAILDLQPVTFRYKKEYDSKAIPQFGLVAEDVAKVNPSLVARDETGKPYTVRYEAVNAMLLNEFLKEHKKVEEQADKIERLETRLQDLDARLSANGL
ncbi:MAG TPA: tail fiber domain-containing protein [Chthoniobacterales bacterium]|jgi:hypothetical protein